MTRLVKTLIQGTGVLIGFFTWYSALSAAPVSFYFRTPGESLPPQSEFEAVVMVDSAVPLNAYNLVLTYSPDALDVVYFDNSRSIIDIWQSQPLTYQNGEIKFAGGSFKAFQGQRGELMTIRFKTLREGPAMLGVKTAEAYIADGKGTKAESVSLDFALTIREGAPFVRTPKPEDNTPPQINALSFAEDPFNPEQRLLSFLVKDNESGVKQTLVRYRTWLTWSDWQPVQNPAAIPRNAWSVSFRVSDNFENQTAQIFYYWPALFKNLSPVILIIALVIVLLGIRKKRQPVAP